MKRRGFLTKLFVSALAAPSIVRAAITKAPVQQPDFVGFNFVPGHGAKIKKVGDFITITISNNPLRNGKICFFNSGASCDKGTFMDIDEAALEVRE